MNVDCSILFCFVLPLNMLAFRRVLSSVKMVPVKRAVPSCPANVAKGFFSSNSGAMDLDGNETVEECVAKTTLPSGERVPGWEAIKRRRGPAGMRLGNKQRNKRLIGDAVNSWYPTTLEEALGGDFTSLKKERRKNQLERLRRRGKGPPRKGEGKRSGKK